MLTSHTITDKDTWNNTLRTLPAAHVLQTWEWGAFKHATTGWTPLRLVYKEGDTVVAMASVGIRRIGPLKVMYIPKGPALDYGNAALVADVLDHLQALARRERAVWLKLDPDVIAGRGVPGEDAQEDANGEAVSAALQQRGWRFSNDQVQFRNTVTLDLTQDEDTLLAAMSQNTRRKVRTAEKKGVTVRAGTAADLPILYDLYRVTGERDDFLTRPAAYYEQAWRVFMEAGLAQPLIAEFAGKPVAHVILFHFGRKCWYFYGASSNEERERMPNYLLQWEAMRWAKTHGYAVYDMWGAPDVFDESDSLWGVFQFKRGFRGVVTRHIGAWDYVPFPPLYWGYTQVWPRLLAALRRHG